MSPVRVEDMHAVPTVTVDQVPADLPSDLTVVDVREPYEWAAGHIEGARHIPLQELPVRLDELPDAGRLLVVCKVGGRSAQAVAYLTHYGRDAVNLDGGMLEWAGAGRAMVSDGDLAPQVV